MSIFVCAGRPEESREGSSRSEPLSPPPLAHDTYSRNGEYTAARVTEVDALKFTIDEKQEDSDPNTDISGGLSMELPPPAPSAGREEEGDALTMGSCFGMYVCRRFDCTYTHSLTHSHIHILSLSLSHTHTHATYTGLGECVQAIEKSRVSRLAHSPPGSSRHNECEPSGLDEDARLHTCTAFDERVPTCKLVSWALLFVGTYMAFSVVMLLWVYTLHRSFPKYV
jgi:hypothetical protein